MPGPRLAVRLAVISFGLLILLGAWLVSLSEPPAPEPPAPQPKERPLGE